MPETHATPNDKWFTDGCRDALQRMVEHASKVGLPNTDEFTFRSFFMSELISKNRCSKLQTEWHKFDLLLQNTNGNYLIEFKYFLYRHTYALDGSMIRKKGGPSPKNEVEFWDCVEKLSQCDIPGIDRKYLVLIYQQTPTDMKGRTYAQSYDSISSSDKSVIAIKTIKTPPLRCKILRIR